MARTLLAAALAGCAAMAAALPVSSAIITHSSPATFQAALSGSFTLINLDGPPFNGFASGYRVEDAGPAAAFAALGLDFFAVNARILGGQDSQIPTPGRDRLIFNGTGFDGEIRVNFINPVNGIGAFSNNIDFGRIRAFSGADLGGSLLGEVQFGPGGFGGLTGADPIGSALFTCDFDQDRRCGVYDIQFGTRGNNLPEPATLLLLVSATLSIVATRCRDTRARRRTGVSRSG